MSEKQYAEIEQLAEYKTQVDTMIAQLKVVGAKEEFYELEESAMALLDRVEALRIPEKDELIDMLTTAVTEADVRVSEGRSEIEGAGVEEELEEAA